MKTLSCWLMFAVVLAVGSVRGDEPLDVSGTYQRILADYQRIAATGNNDARSAAVRLTRDAYRLLIDQAQGVKDLSADDLHALGTCPEGLGERDRAKELYAKSLKTSPLARTHLSLCRVSLRDDLKAADTHFAEAVKLQPEHPGLGQFRLLLAAAHQAERNWDQAIAHLEHYLGYTKTLLDSQPGNSRLRARHAVVQKQLDKLRRFSGMTGNAAPPLKVKQWVQGDATDLDGLKGKVVLVDFCALWAEPSRKRMEKIKDLHAKYAEKGLETVGVTLAYHHSYDTETDKVTYDEKLPPKDERAGIAAFAKKHEIPWRLGVIDREIVAEYGVSTLPHSVLLDKKGQVKMILLASGPDDDAELERTVKGLLGLP